MSSVLLGALSSLCRDQPCTRRTDCDERVVELPHLGRFTVEQVCSQQISVPTQISVLFVPFQYTAAVAP